jgi:hypothetical protein
VERSVGRLATIAASLLLLIAPPCAAAAATRALDVLPVEGLIASSVAVLRDQAALDAHYYLADEDLLGLGRRTDAVFARYKTEGGESSILVAVYRSAEEAGRVYARFGGDFFSERFDPRAPRAVERLETGDWAAAARAGRYLIVVLESPDREACEDLLGKAEQRVPGTKPR